MPAIRAMPKQRIVIVGGGFGGVECARTLHSLLRHGDTEFILFNKENNLVFSPCWPTPSAPP